jgi:Osmosensitive K+ channel histidine kinase
MLTRQRGTEMIIYPLSVVNDDEDASVTIKKHKELMERLTEQAAATETKVTPVTRVDINIPTGISRTAKELFVTKVVMGWSGRSATANYFFGNIIDNLLESTQQMVMVVKINQPIARLRNILVLLPDNADREIGFTSCISTLTGLSKNTGGKVKFLISAKMVDILKARLKEYKFFNGDHYVPYEYYPNISTIPFPISQSDLVVMIAARPSTLSFSRRQLIIPKLMASLANEMNFIIIYPEQVEVSEI